MSAKITKTIDLNLISNTINLMNKAKDFKVISEIIFNFIQNFVNYNMIVIYRLNEMDEVLEIVSCLGSNTEKMKRRLSFKLGEGAVGLVAKDKKALLINDVLKSKEIKVRQYYDEDPIIRSFMAIPLVVGDKVIGILSVSCSLPHQYTEADMHMINIIVSQGAVLLELNNSITDAERFSNQILENINSGVIVVNAKAEIVSFNKAAEEITGYSSDLIIGKNIVNIPFSENEDDWYILRSMKTNQIYFEKSAYLRRKDGKYLKLRLSTSLIYNKDNTIKTCICIFRDTTELENLQKQIVMADKLAALGRLTAGITHEIRNPLLPIRNASQYLFSKYKEDENNKEVVKLLNIIIEESERLNRFLEQLSNLSKDNLICSGESSLDEVLEEILLLLKYNLNISRIKINVNIPTKGSKLLLSKDNLKQVLLNLVLNSIDAINLNGVVEPRVISINGIIQNRHIILEVIDTGKGIPRKIIENVFDPFYTTKDTGTGLGLPIILNIIKNCGGNVLIDSKFNEGTKVTLIIPIVKKD